MPFHVIADRMKRGASETVQKIKSLASQEEHPMSDFKTRNAGSA